MKAFLSILLFILHVPQICFGQGYWIKIGDMPEIRLAHTADEINGKIYLVGGGDYEGGTDETTALVYDRSSGIWTKIPLNNNEIREFHTSCVVDGKLYVIGGWILVNNQWVASNKIDMYDPVSGMWSSKDTMPTSRGNLGCAVIDDKIYVIGGTQGDLGLNTLEVYNTADGTWKKLSGMPTGRWGISAQAFNGKIYVFGGRSINDYSVFASVEVYDPYTDTWTTKSNMPTARYGFTACLLDSMIYTIGGWLESSPPGPIYDKVEIYEPNCDKWRTAAPLPVPRALLASVVINRKIYVYGGSRTNHPLIGTSEIYEFSYDNIFAQQPSVDKTYLRVNLDSVLFRTRFSNFYNHQFTPNLIIRNLDSTYTDSLSLYDDGLHGDSLSKDGLYGMYIPPRETEEFFTLSTSTIDNQNSTYYYTPDRCRFTTTGPLTVDSIYFKNSPSLKWYSIGIFLLNKGKTQPLTNVSVRITCNDTWVVSMHHTDVDFPEIPPGGRAPSNQFFGIFYDSSFPGYFNLKFEISSDGWTYWKDSMKFSPVTGIKDLELQPAEYMLSQNFPNPFNPVTVINFGIKQNGNVKITLFNIIGQQVAVLLNEQMHSGYHQVEFNGANLPSGIYFYRIQAGNYAETKKMVLLK